MRTIYALLAAALAGLSCAAARADDFASDLATCAKGQIDTVQSAIEDGPVAANFVINHSECVPMVVGGDPLLYGLSGLVAVMQNESVLPKGAQACVDASIGQASKPVAGALDMTLSKTGLSSVLPSKGIQLLRDIAEGKSKATLYEVPGVGIVMDKVACSCAVASTALDIDKLKDRVLKVVKTAGACTDVAKKLLEGAYGAAKAAAGAVGGAAKEAYEKGKKIVNDIGCATIGMGCDDGPSGPPFFCTGFDSLRAQNISYEDIKSQSLLSIFGAEKLEPQFAACEQSWQDRLKKAQDEIALKKEQERQQAEYEKAGQLGAANGLGLAFRWIPQCADKQCQSAVSKYADQYTAEIQDEYTIKQQYGSFNNAKAALDKKYDALCKLAVVLSKDRVNKSLRDDVSAPAAKRLPAFGCRNFLGREGEYLCAATPGYSACQDYAVKGEAELCVSTAKPSVFFSSGGGLERVLRRAGCIPNAASEGAVRGVQSPLRVGAVATAQCLSASGRATCDALARGRSGVRCEGPQYLALNRSAGLRNAPTAPPAIRPIAPIAPLEPAPEPEPVRPRGAGPEPAPMPRLQPNLVRPSRPAEVQKSTLCAFNAGPRAGERQDYAPMDPLPVGTPCHDGRGSTGLVVAP